MTVKLLGELFSRWTLIEKLYNYIIILLLNRPLEHRAIRSSSRSLVRCYRSLIRLLLTAQGLRCTHPLARLLAPELNGMNALISFTYNPLRSTTVPRFIFAPYLIHPVPTDVEHHEDCLP